MCGGCAHAAGRRLAYFVRPHNPCRRPRIESCRATFAPVVLRPPSHSSDRDSRSRGRHHSGCVGRSRKDVALACVRRAICATPSQAANLFELDHRVAPPAVLSSLVTIRSLTPKTSGGLALSCLFDSGHATPSVSDASHSCKSMRNEVSHKCSGAMCSLTITTPPTPGFSESCRFADQVPNR